MPSLLDSLSSRDKRKNVCQAFKFLGIESEAEMRLQDPKHVLDLLKTRTVSKRTRMGIRILIRHTDLLGDSRWRIVAMRSNAQHPDLHVLVSKRIPKNSRGSPIKAIALAMEFLGITEPAAIQNFSVEQLYNLVSQSVQHTKNRIIVYGINLLLEDLGCPERLVARRVRELNFGVAMTKTEAAWYDETNRPDWYEGFKASFHDWVQSVCQPQGLSFVTIVGHFRRGCAIVRASGMEAISLTTDVLNGAVLVVITAAGQDGSSLLSMKRGHRNGEALDPWRGMVGAYHRALMFLVGFLQLPIDGLISVPELRQKAKRLPVPCDSLTQPPVDDALTLEEMDQALAQCVDIHERMIMLFLRPLGMRIGAVANLRISGVVNDYQCLKPGMDRWVVTSVIAAHDKGDAINQWFIEPFPVVRECLDQYVNEWWRPHHEAWEGNDDVMRLTQCLLFPCQVF